ncbi:MAG TPA: GNAT family N-acetyltransferase [Ignavibacteria bacterium]|nr:GNAT family N-acetyltransferase [Ignavibacteria bacterium]
MNENIIIREYKPEDESKWLDIHAGVMVDSYAWWTVIHKKIVYEKEVIDLVACSEGKITGFLVAEINSDVCKEKDTAFVWDFGVQRKHRNKKTGTNLIAQLHKIMNEKFNINKSIWYTQDPDSQKFYEHIGMKEIGRHWQLSIEPVKDQLISFRENKFVTWSIRGSCEMDDLEKVKSVYKVSEDDSLKPMICVGYEFVL